MISEQRLERLADLAFLNCIRLHYDAIALVQNGSFASAKFLSIHALEELGKVLLLGDLLYALRTGSLSEHGLKSALSDLYSHRTKQLRSRRETTPLARSVIQQARAGDLERVKQDSVYVGLARERNVIDYTKRVRNPMKVTRKQAENQISEFANLLLELASGVLVGVYGLDTSQAEARIDRKLLDELVKAWGPTKRRARHLVARVHSGSRVSRT